jgi:hypothetical protein
MDTHPEGKGRLASALKKIGILLGGAAVMALLGSLIASWIVTMRYGPNEDPGETSPAAAAPLPPAVYERPSPTPEQEAAVAGAEPVTWPQQGIAWSLPGSWTRASADERSCLFQGGGGAALSASATPMAAGTSPESSLEAFYAQSVPKQKGGAYDELRYLELDGVKGVLWREAAPSAAGARRNLNWIGYRKRGGGEQLVTITLGSPAGDFARHEPALYGILYSTTIPK